MIQQNQEEENNINDLNFAMAIVLTLEVGMIVRMTDKGLNLQQNLFSLPRVISV
jgi:hypothetical protein